jgi:threonine/homoserine/homoserine lactone efflux protein
MSFGKEVAVAFSVFPNAGRYQYVGCMLEWQTVWIFVGASVAVTIAPGPDNTFVLAQGISQRRKQALAAAWGMVSGVLVHTLLAALGVSALLLASEGLFHALQVVGAAYLLYLAWLTLRTTRNVSQVDARIPAVSIGAMFRRGFLMNVLNPKVGVFFISFLPQFASGSAGQVRLQMVVLGLIFMLQAGVLFTLLACFASAIGRCLNRSARAQRGLSLLTAGVFVGLAVKLIWGMM